MSRNSLKDSIISITKSSSAKSSFEGKCSPEITLITLTHSSQHNKIKSFLNKHPNLSLTTMKDIRFTTLLHIACLNNRSDIAKLFLEYLKVQGMSDEEIKDWVNEGTDEGLAAIHFGAFKGSIELIELLESYGADIHVKNNQGLNVMHIGAQGDQPVSLAYFMKKGMDIHELDNKGSTPLHWAAFLGMESAAAYLASWGSDLNRKDTESGFTPLHFAAANGNSKVVRRLLLKGADRHVKDNEGKTAKDLAEEHEYYRIRKLLEGRNWFVECFNIKQGLQRKRTRYSLALFIVLFLLSFFGNFFFVLPYVENEAWVVLLIASGAVTSVFFLLSWLTNPGLMKNKKSDDILSLLLKNEADKICPECVILKPERSRHCEFCGACVSVFDHHCPWINNCVGARNHKYFLLFIFSTLLSIIFLGILAAFHIGKTEPLNKYSVIDWEDMKVLFQIKEGVCAWDLVMTVIFGIPLILLNSIQMKNFIKGQTTNERFGYQGGTQGTQGTNREPLRHRSDDMTTTAEGEHMHDHGENKKGGFIINCQAMCCENARDSKYNYQKVGIN